VTTQSTDTPQLDRRKRYGGTSVPSTFMTVTDPSTGKTIWVGYPRDDHTWGIFGTCAGDYDLADRLYSDSLETAWEAAAEGCTFCPTKHVCLESGITRGEIRGTWGGYPADSPEFRKHRRLAARRHTTPLEEAA
jgi:hypothetical protein